MRPSSAAILSAALTLPPEDREELAERLLQSLDEADDAALSPEWKVEIQRRLKEIDDGAVELVDGEEVMQWLRSKARGDAKT